MSITERIEKRQLIIDLGGAGETPTAWRWRVMKYFTYPDGTEAGTRADEIPATQEEVAAHIGASVLAQARDIAADKIELDAIKARLAKAEEAMHAVISADRSWDEAVREKIIGALS